MTNLDYPNMIYPGTQKWVEWKKQEFVYFDRALLLFFDRCIRYGYSLCRIDTDPKILISLDEDDLKSINKEIFWEAPLDYKYPNTIEIIKNKQRNDFFKIEALPNIGFMIVVPKLNENNLFYYHMIIGFDEKFEGHYWDNMEKENAQLREINDRYRIGTEFGVKTKKLLDDLNLETVNINGVYRFDPGYHVELIYFNYEYFFSFNDNIFNDSGVSKIEYYYGDEFKNDIKKKKYMVKTIGYKKLRSFFITWNKFSDFYTTILANIMSDPIFKIDYSTYNTEEFKDDFEFYK